MQKIRVGIIGLGLSGKYFHAPFIKAIDGFKITSICSSRTSEINSLFSDVKIYTDALDLIKSSEVDLVINCAPNSQHFNLTAAALKAGKHVVVEKPFVNTVEEGEALIKLAQEHGRVLSVFHNRRWDGDFLTVAELIKSGRLGKIKQFESHFDRFRPEVPSGKWREMIGPGSGTFYDLGTHLIDQAFFLFGKPDSYVIDVEKQRAHSEVNDYFHVILKYQEKRVILHSTSFGNVAPRFALHGEKGNFVKFGMDPQEGQLKAGMSPTDPAFGVDHQNNFGKLIVPNESLEVSVPTERGRYIDFYHMLLNAIVRGEPVPVTAESALEVIKLVAADL